MVLLARTAPGSKGLSIFFMPLDKTAPGLTLRTIPKMGAQAVDANEVFFDNYRIPASCRLGAEGDGFKIVRSQFNIGSLNDAAKSLIFLTVKYTGVARDECRAGSYRSGSSRARIRRAASGRKVRARAQCLWAPDREKPEHPACPCEIMARFRVS